MSNDMPARLSVIVPLKGREEFTKRFLRDFHERKLPYKLILADGSRDVLFGDISYENENIRHIKYRYDATVKDYLTKMNLTLDLVDTPYAMLVDNDDFLGNGIEQAIDFLEGHPDYVCAAGRTVGFSITGGARPYGTINRLYEYYGPKGKSVTAAAPAQRIRDGANRLWIFYAVHRTEALRTICKDDCSIDFSDLMLHEYFHVARSLSLGKAHFDQNTITYWRQYGTSASSPHPEDSDWAVHLLRSTFSQDVERLTNRIALSSGTTKGEIQDITVAVLETLTAKYNQFLSATYSPSHRIVMALRRAFRIIDNWIRHRPRLWVNRQLVPAEELKNLEIALTYQTNKQKSSFHGGQTPWRSEQRQAVS